jgi:hypothetical protein
VQLHFAWRATREVVVAALSRVTVLRRDKRGSSSEQRETGERELHGGERSLLRGKYLGLNVGVGR